MEDNRCAKHGTFSGNVGCPFCRDEKAAVSDPQQRAAQGVEIVGGGGVQGVQKLSQREADTSAGALESKVIIGKNAAGDNA